MSRDSEDHLAKMRHYQSERDRGRVLLRIEEAVLRDADEAVRRAEGVRDQARRKVAETQGWINAQAASLAHHTEHYLNALAKENEPHG